MGRRAIVSECGPSSPAADASYERDKHLAADADVEVRRRLAGSGTARPEILYYLAADEAAIVRREIAANEAAPVHADLLLVRDPDDEVRAELAHKLARKAARLVPAPVSDPRTQTGLRIVEMLEILAQDQAVRVRQAVSETLRDVASAPPELIRGLALDREPVVASPVLRRSPLLTEDDLLKIIRERPTAGSLTAIAERAGVTAAVAEAIIAAGDTTAIGALLENSSAQIGEDTLERVVDRAPAHVAWHRPLVDRPFLPAKIVRRIASFLTAALLRKLQQRADLDPDTRGAVSVELQRRQADEQRKGSGDHGVAETAEEQVARLMAAGALNETKIAAALEDGRRPFVKAAVAALSGISAEIVDKILSSHSAKGIVAVAWKAGLTPRIAVQLQLRVGGIAPKQLLSPRPGGAWPLTPEEMIWHLEFFGA